MLCVGQAHKIPLNGIKFYECKVVKCEKAQKGRNTQTTPFYCAICFGVVDYHFYLKMVIIFPNLNEEILFKVYLSCATSLFLKFLTEKY